MTLADLDRPAPDGARITIRDEALSRAQSVDMLLRLAAAELTAAELIAERVRAECDRRLTDAAGALAAPLVTPTAEEQALNASDERRPAEETETQVARALDAFAAGAFLLLVDDRQVESAEEPVRLSDGTVVTFLRLTPLVGG